MIKLIPLKESYTISRLSHTDRLPVFPAEEEFFSVTFTPEEISLVCRAGMEHEGTRHPERWKGFRVKGLLDLSSTGILHKLTSVLNEGKIPVFTLSTYNTDYLFVREKDMESASEYFTKRMMMDHS